MINQAVRRAASLSIFPLAAFVLSGCGSADGDFEFKLREKARRVSEVAAAIAREHTDPQLRANEKAKLDRIMQQVFSNMNAKDERIRNNQSYGDIDDNTYELTAQVKELGARDRVLGKQWLDATVDFDSFLASLSDKCGNGSERTAKIVASIDYKKNLFGKTGENLEGSFWKMKWEHDAKLEEPSAQPNCKTLNPVIDALITQIHSNQSELEAFQHPQK